MFLYELFESRMGDLANILARIRGDEDYGDGKPSAVVTIDDINNRITLNFVLDGTPGVLIMQYRKEVFNKKYNSTERISYTDQAKSFEEKIISAARAQNRGNPIPSYDPTKRYQAAKRFIDGKKISVQAIKTLTNSKYWEVYKLNYAEFNIPRRLH